MKAFLARMKAWLKSKNITTHTIGVTIVSFAAVYNSSPALRNYIGTVLVGFPVVVTKIGVLCADIAAGVTLWRNYSRSSSQAGTMAQADAIKSGPNPPTESQVRAADTTKL